MAGSLVDRMIGAAFLSPATYEEVEHDSDATGQAAVVVLLAALATGIGAWSFGGRGIIGGILSALVGWLAWSAVTWLVGTMLFGGTATWGELLRTLGFAQTPRLLLVVVGIPILGSIAGLIIVPVVAVWTLVAGLVAVKQALDFSTGKAIVTVLVGWLVSWMLTAAFGIPIGG